MELKVINDCYKLIENFVNNNSPHFESFHTQWKFNTFQHIYTAQSSTIEILQTTNILFYIAKCMVCGLCNVGDKIEGKNASSNSCILRRVGGLYLMYAVYFKQPTRQYVKIQISFQTWMRIMDFIASLEVLPTTCEARYVFWRLYQKDAFRFCASDYHVGLENLIDFDSINVGAHNNGIGSGEVHLKYKLNDLCETQTKLTEMIKLEDSYNNTKKELALTMATSAQYLPTSDIFHNIQGTLNTLRDIMKATQQSAPPENVSKRALKRKAFNFDGESSTIEKMSSSSSSDETKQEDIEKYNYKRTFRRMSCKSLFIEKLPDSVLNNLE